MPDISMCNNTLCTLRQNCYRYRAVPNPGKQSFGGFKQKEDTTCDHHWSIDIQPKGWFTLTDKE